MDSFIHRGELSGESCNHAAKRDSQPPFSLSPLRVANWKFYLDQRRRNCAAAPDNKTEPFCRQMKLNFSAARVCFCAERYVFMSCPPHAIKAAQLLSLARSPSRKHLSWTHLHAVASLHRQISHSPSVSPFVIYY
jgi:hypothetical protein